MGVVAAGGEGGSGAGEMADASRGVRSSGGRERGGTDKVSVGVTGLQDETWAFNWAFFSSFSSILTSYLLVFFFSFKYICKPECILLIF